jgi:hypothetical protein
MRICLFRVNRMAYIGAEGVAIGIFPGGGADYSENYKNYEQNNNGEQDRLSVDTDLHDFGDSI